MPFFYQWFNAFVICILFIKMRSKFRMKLIKKQCALYLVLIFAKSAGNFIQLFIMANIFHIDPSRNINSLFLIYGRLFMNISFSFFLRSSHKFLAKRKKYIRVGICLAGKFSSYNLFTSLLFSIFLAYENHIQFLWDENLWFFIILHDLLVVLQIVNANIRREFKKRQLFAFIIFPKRLKNQI